MKFMLMMNAPSGNGDWGISKWAPEELKAHIAFHEDVHGWTGRVRRARGC